MIDSPVFFSGIGGSGMLPLASIVRASGAKVSGSDRSLDAGRTPHKFDYLRSLGIQLFPQDGSGLQPGMTLVTSAAVEPTVPDVVRAKELGLSHLTRPQFLAQLLNSAQRSVAVGGTSGKSTVTGMIGWILHACHRQPTVMNGAVMKNFVTPSAPFASALVGDPELFVSEVDESDGSIALYQPEIAVLTNISLDHKEMEELRSCSPPSSCVAQGGGEPRRPRNARDRRRHPADNRLGYGFDSPGADFMGKDLQLGAGGRELRGRGRRRARRCPARGARTPQCVERARRDRGGARARRARAGCGGGARPLRGPAAEAGDGRRARPASPSSTISRTIPTRSPRRWRPSARIPGRLLIMFQPHGYGPLTKMGERARRGVAGGMAPGDRLYLPDPVYQGGTVERTRGSTGSPTR